jgi:hypothetical protein
MFSLSTPIQAQEFQLLPYGVRQLGQVNPTQSLLNHNVVLNRQKPLDGGASRVPPTSKPMG